MQGIIVNFTFDSKTLLKPSMSCLKLNSLLWLLNKLCPPSQITSILSTIFGYFDMAIDIFVIAPIAIIYVFLFLFAISFIFSMASVFSS
ncbi:hypothetical protein D3C76_1476050 [compost metagenome]